MSTKTHPILFSTPMVQSILKGLKTMTRRPNGLDTFNETPDQWEFKKLQYHPQVGLQAYFADKNGDPSKLYGAKFPYGNIGDVLWVRETITILEPEHCMGGMDSRFVYKANADADSEEIRKEYVKMGYPYQWIPSIHMPKTACRIWFEITNVRVERLKDITRQDAIAEGIDRKEKDSKFLYRNYCDKTSPYANPIGSFCSLWIKLHDKNSWDKNPWLWVIEFKRVEKPQNF